MSFEATEELSERAKAVINELFNSGSSEAHAVADCLNTIAENGDDGELNQASDEYIVTCAKQIIEAARRVIAALPSDEEIKKAEDISRAAEEREKANDESLEAYFEENEIDSNALPQTVQGIADMMEARLDSEGMGGNFDDTDDIFSEYEHFYGTDRLVRTYQEADRAGRIV